jgi:hypothetical protein
VYIEEKSFSFSLCPFFFFFFSKRFFTQYDPHHLLSFFLSFFSICSHHKNDERRKELSIEERERWLIGSERFSREQLTEPLRVRSWTEGRKF